MRRNDRRRVSEVPNPHRRAMSSTDRRWVLEQPTGGFDTGLLDETGRRDPDLGAERPGEVSGAHGRPLRPGARPEVGVEVVDGEPLHLGQIRRAR